MLNAIKAIISIVFLGLIAIYRNILSPMLPATCRYTPTCSKYAAHAIEKYGPFKGGWLAIRRISRCHPWSKSHGHDPVP